MNPSPLKQIIILLLCSLPPQSLYGWVNVTGPSGQQIHAFIAHDDCIIADFDSSSDIYISTNNCATWRLINRGLPSIAQRPLLVSDSIILMDTYNGIYRSSDYGTNWNGPVAPRPLSISTPENEILMHADVYPSGYPHLYYSSDLGTQWETDSVKTTFSYMEFRYLSMWGTIVVALVYNSSVYLSVDRGSTWNKILTGDSNQIQALLVSDSTIYMGNGNRLLISHDLGSTWNTVFFDSKIVSLATGDNTVWAHTTHAVMRSVDTGSTWTTAVADSSIRGISVHGQSIGLITDHRIVLSSNNGNMWNDVYLCDSLQSIAVGGRTIVVNTLSEVLLSTDYGQTWSSLTSKFPLFPISEFQVIDNTVHACTQMPNLVGHSIFIFNNTFSDTCLCEANSWNPSPCNLPLYFASSERQGPIMRKCGPILYNRISQTCRGCALNHLSIDNGVTWESINYSVNDIIAINDSYLQCTSAGIFHSSDNGSTWDHITSGIPNSTNIPLLVEYNNAVFALADSNIYRSIDNGLNWSRTSYGLPDTAHVTTLATNGTFLFSGTTQNDIYRYTPDNNGWIPITNPFPRIHDITKLTCNNLSLFATTTAPSRTVWYTPLNEVVAIGTPPPIPPQRFGINTNSERGVVKIRCTLPYRRSTSITVHDIQGRTVESIVNEPIGPGDVAFLWDTRRFSSGFYVVRFRYGDESTVFRQISLTR